MSRENHGESWSSKDEKKLEEMLYDGASYEEMAKKLGRTWYACKCRLIKLKLIPFEPQGKKTNVERYDVPARYVNNFIEVTTDTIKMSNEEDTSRTFSDAELNIVMDYFKTRLAKLAVQKLNCGMFVSQIEIARAEELFTNEISKIKMAKQMSIECREKALTRIA